MRARTFYAESQSLDVMDVEVPVVGGHAGVTILPLFSQASPFKELSGEKAEALTRRTQDGGTEVVQAKAGKARNSSLGTLCRAVVGLRLRTQGCCAYAAHPGRRHQGRPAKAGKARRQALCGARVPW